MRSRLVVLLVLALAGCSSTPSDRVVGEVVAQPEPVPVVPQPRGTHPPPAVRQERPTHVLPLVPRGCSPRAEACVSVVDRLAWLQRDGRVVHGPVPVALGRPGHRTPKGRFQVVWKDEENTSSIYGIDMPYSVFFAAGGIAFHEGPLDEPSHGCVHLGPAAARAFFAELDRGERVHVF